MENPGMLLVIRNIYSLTRTSHLAKSSFVLHKSPTTELEEVPELTPGHKEYLNTNVKESFMEN
jgi:hypothetical protein